MKSTHFKNLRSITQNNDIICEIRTFIIILLNVVASFFKKNIDCAIIILKEKIIKCIIEFIVVLTCSIAKNDYRMQS